eukprot:4979688-Lingulodinium_polyedra.AAC.1
MLTSPIATHILQAVWTASVSPGKSASVQGNTFFSVKGSQVGAKKLASTSMRKVGRSRKNR